MASSTTISSHKNLQGVLSTIFASAARVAVLRALLVDPTRAYYQRQLEAASGLPIRAIQRELERLTKIGLLYRHVEGNRAYYRVDPDFPFYEELRSLVLKVLETGALLRSELALIPEVRLAFLAEEENEVLVVLHTMGPLALEAPAGIAVAPMSSEDFLDAVRNQREPVHGFLSRGTDMLGRRDDLIWRHIETAGYLVKKGDGVA